MALDDSKLNAVLGSRITAFFVGAFLMAVGIEAIHLLSNKPDSKAPPVVQLPAASCEATCPSMAEPASNRSMPRISAANCNTLCVNQNPVLEVAQDGAAASLIVVCNKAEQPVPSLALAVDAFTAIGSDGRPYELNGLGKLSGDREQDKPVVLSKDPLAGNACVHVRLEVSHLMSSRPMVATLRNGTTEIATIAAYMPVVPFKLSIDSPTPDKLALSVTRDMATSIPIKNDDPIGYCLAWTLDLGDSVVEGCANIPAKSANFSLPLPIDKLNNSDATNASAKPHAELLNASFGFLSSGFITPNRKEGRLILRRYPDELFKNAPLQSLVIKGDASFHYWGQSVQKMFFAICTFFVLLAGVLSSLCINFMLPMWRKRTALKQALTTQERALNGQGALIGAKTLVSLRAEVRRLWYSVASQPVFIPETESSLPVLDTRIQALAQRIDPAREAARILADAHADLSLSIFEFDAVTSLCADVSKIVEVPSLSEPDRQKALEKLKAADDILKRSEDDPTEDAIKVIQVRRTALAEVSFDDPLPPRLLSDGQSLSESDTAAWTTIVGFLTEFKGSNRLTETPSREDFVAESTRLWRAEIVVEFARLVTDVEEPEVCRKRLARVHDLFETLRPGSTYSPVATRQVLAEVRQNVAKADLVKALLGVPKSAAKPDGVNEPGQVSQGAASAHGPLPSIEISPRKPLPLQLVELRVTFAAPGLNVADARRSIKCQWTINDKEIEGTEFSTYCFFKKISLRERAVLIVNRKGLVRRFNVKARFCDGIHDFATLENYVDVRADRELLRSSTVLAAFSMAITVVIVTVGLLAVAQEKLQSADVISGIVALLVLGFGADVIKRSLTKN